MEPVIFEGHWLPVAFAALMGIAVLLYVILDGYDLGVGMLMHGMEDSEQDKMLASIGPFWDANETWLVLGIGLLLVAFPAANGIILTSLYLPTFLMITGLILRGVAFDFRVKVRSEHKHRWNRAFFCGSLMASLSQGYMLGRYIMGLDGGWIAQGFSLLTALCLAGGYCFIGACWLIMKTEKKLQKKAILRARFFLWFTMAGIGAVSMASPLVSHGIYERWFSLPSAILMLPIPLFTLVVFAGLEYLLPRLPLKKDAWSFLPVLGAIVLFFLCFIGLAYSFYPFVIPGKMTVWDAASSQDALMFIFWGAIIVLPCILAYTVYAYKVFWGKVGELRYD